MRVNRNRLDLKTLIAHVPCMITTGSSSIRILHGSHSVEMGMYLTGVGRGPISSDRITSIQDERGKGHPTYWLHLDRLAPRRLYEVLVTSREADGSPGWQISDRTPEHGAEPDGMQSGGQSWSLLARLLGRRGE